MTSKTSSDPLGTPISLSTLDQTTTEPSGTTMPKVSSSGSTWLSTGETPLPMLDSSLPISVSTFKKTTPMTSSGASEPTTADSTTWLSSGETPLPMLDSSLPTLLVTTAATDSFG